MTRKIVHTFVELNRQDDVGLPLWRDSNYLCVPPLGTQETCRNLESLLSLGVENQRGQRAAQAWSHLVARRVLWHVGCTSSPGFPHVQIRRESTLKTFTKEAGVVAHAHNSST